MTPAPCPCRTVWACAVLVALVSLGLAVGGELARWEDRAALLEAQLAVTEAKLETMRALGLSVGRADHEALLTTAIRKGAEDDAAQIRAHGERIGAIPPADPAPQKRASQSLRSGNRPKR